MQFGPALRATSAIAVLSVMDAVIKAMAAHYSTLQIAFLRFGCGLIIVSGVVAVLRPGRPSRETIIASGIRSLLAVVTATAFFYALGQLPLAETLVLSFLAPMFVALFGVVMLGERADRRTLAALAAGFAGTLIVVLGQFDTAEQSRSWTGVAAALFSAVTYALSLVLLRARAQRDPLLHIIFLQHLGSTLLLAPFAYAVWETPPWEHLAVFALIGVLGVTGHVLLTTAFARDSAARLASLEYTALIWATVIGYGAFGEIPTWTTIAGAVLIVVGAVITSRR